jgi:phosphate starvation-inducible PhoH-like protein
MKKDGGSQLSFDDLSAVRAISGPGGGFLKAVENELNVRISQRGGNITVTGSPHQVMATKRALEQVYLVAQNGEEISEADLLRAIDWNRRDEGSRMDALTRTAVSLSGPQRTVVPKTPNQAKYLVAIKEEPLVFCLGPAGTGKTFLAMAMAVSALRKRAVQKIILTRPAVEAGERLGFLPGTLLEKVNPYLRPLYDALFYMMEREEVSKLIERDQIEVVPLAFMRGRTLDDAFIILDEAQNTTVEQMKMLLTRMGEHSQLVITGDVTQVDLPKRFTSGLSDAIPRLEHLEGVRVVRLDASDVMRHRMVQRIVRAYERPRAEPQGQDADTGNDLAEEA